MLTAVLEPGPKSTSAISSRFIVCSGVKAIDCSDELLSRLSDGWRSLTSADIKEPKCQCGRVG
jgi:hypothetical protein